VNVTNKLYYSFVVEKLLKMGSRGLDGQHLACCSAICCCGRLLPHWMTSDSFCSIAPTLGGTKSICNCHQLAKPDSDSDPWAWSQVQKSEQHNFLELVTYSVRGPLDKQCPSLFAEMSGYYSFSHKVLKGIGGCLGAGRYCTGCEECVLYMWYQSDPVNCLVCSGRK